MSRLRTSLAFLGAVVVASSLFVALPVTAAAASTPVLRVIPHDEAAGIKLGPNDVGVDPALHKAYISMGSCSVAVVDTTTNDVLKVIKLECGIKLSVGLTRVTVDPTAHHAYVLNGDEPSVTIIDTIDDSVIAHIKNDERWGVNGLLAGVAVDSGLHRAFVTSNFDNTIAVIDTENYRVVSVFNAESPGGIAIDEKRHLAYVTNAKRTEVSVIDVTTGTLATPIVLERTGGVRGIAFDHTTDQLYVAQPSNDTVSVVDTNSKKVVKLIPSAAAGGVGIGSGPSWIAIDPASSTALVTNLNSGTVSVIDTTEDVVTEVIGHDEAVGIGTTPSGIAVDPATHRAYVVNRGSSTVSVLGVQSNAAVSRIGGADRYAVSAAISAGNFAARTSTVFIASGENFPDALSASARAGAVGAPVLLVTRDNVPNEVAAELVRLKPDHIFIMGGVNTISDALAQRLAAYAGATTRVGGADRYEVSANASAQFPARVPVAYIASGQTFPDALSGSAAAGRLGAPVLLVTRDGIPASVQTELNRLRPTRIVVLGGPNTINDAVRATLFAYTPTNPVLRIAGEDRFAVSAGISAEAFPDGAKTVFVASGAVFPDALSGSAAAIAGEAPVLLVSRESIPDAVKAELDRLDPRRIVVLGGTNTVSDAALTQLNAYIVRT